MTTAKPISENFSFDQMDSLESDLRTGFLLFCNRTPALAAEYLRSVIARPRNDNIIRSILKFSGALAQAAPAELADLTLNALIPAQKSNDVPRARDEMRGPFTFLDSEFIPASPAQGPFLKLLIHAPTVGLALVRRLVDHALSFYTDGRTHDANAIVITHQDGDVIFPWTRSYAWSREASSCYSVTSALMALEAWAHQQIEAGQPFENVLTTVLDSANTPAAYLLLAVDLLLSHWPVSRDAAVPFLGCPELLCMDRQRVAYDNFEYPDFLGLRALDKEPTGLVRLDDLKRRPSRRLSLDQLIGQYAVSKDAELRERLTQLLRRAAERLGPPGDQSDLSDPRMMALHALNLVDPANWREVPCTLPDGTPGTAYEYQASEAEARHFATLQEAAQGRLSDTSMQLAVGIILDDPSRSSSQFATAAVEWAQRAETAGQRDDNSEDDEAMCHRAIVAAATIAIRDGDAELKKKVEPWVRGIFAQAIQSSEDRVLRFRSELRYNAIATAFVGIAHLVKESTSPDDMRALLELAGRDDPAAAHGFGACVRRLADIDERLPRSLLRCAFNAAIRPRHAWEATDEEMRLRSESREQAVRAAIDTELEWFANQRSEPDWPKFPSETPRPRSPIVLPGSRPQRGRPMAGDLEIDYYADYQSAALWLSQIARLGNGISHPWMVEIARTYSSWTATANGAGLDAEDEADNLPREWNEAYFNLLANCLPALALTDIDTLALDPIRSLPDEAFFDVVTIFQRSVDVVYFNDHAFEEAAALHIRTALADRLTASWGWKRIGTGRLGSIETHIGPAIAVLFFNDYGLLTPAKCYLLPEAIGRIELFLPTLEKLVRSGPSLFVALVTLNLVEVAPKAAHAPFLIAAAESWLERFHSESEFWVDHAIGRRVCLWIEAVRGETPCQLTDDDPLRVRTIRLIAALVNLGVAESKQLEEALD